MVDVEGPGYHITQHLSIREGIEFTFRAFVPASDGARADEDGFPLYTDDMLTIALIVPPLHLDAMRVLQEKIANIGREQLQGQMEILVKACGYALKRNYKGVPTWLISQTIDAANYTALMAALMDINGLERRKIEEKKAQAAMTPPPGSSPATSGTGSTMT